MKDLCQEVQHLLPDIPGCCPGGRRASAELQSDLYVKLRCLCEKDHHRASDRHDHIGQVQDGKKQKIIEKATGTGKSSRSPVALFYLSLLLVRILHAAKYHVIAVISIIQ